MKKKSDMLIEKEVESQKVLDIINDFSKLSLEDYSQAKSSKLMEKLDKLIEKIDLIEKHKDKGAIPLNLDALKTIKGKLIKQKQELSSFTQSSIKKFFNKDEYRKKKDNIRKNFALPVETLKNMIGLADSSEKQKKLYQNLKMIKSKINLINELENTDNINKGRGISSEKKLESSGIRLVDLDIINSIIEVATEANYLSELRKTLGLNEAATSLEIMNHMKSNFKEKGSKNGGSYYIPSNPELFKSILNGVLDAYDGNLEKEQDAPANQNSLLAQLKNKLKEMPYPGLTSEDIDKRFMKKNVTKEEPNLKRDLKKVDHNIAKNKTPLSNDESKELHELFAKIIKKNKM